MVNINATTPQLKLVKSVVEAYRSRDLVSSGSIFSKNFKFQSFPKTPDHVEETKGQHLENYGGLLSSFTKMEVRRSRRPQPELSQADNDDPQPVIHEVIEGPGKVVVHVCPSVYNRPVVSDPNVSLRCR